jgi:NAD(P)-dependent dehydrogenase (short-subunit alcohol dehydrogenase family)
MQENARNSDFSGAVAIVTGAGSGMGRELARLLAAQGAQVAVLDLRGAAAADTVAAIVRDGGCARAYPLDVTDSSAVLRAVSTVEAELGPVRHLANLAGIHDFRAIEDIDDALWDRMMRVNVYAQFYMCRAVLPRMMERRFGTLVNMSSIHAVRGESMGAHYAAAKSAITGFTKSIAREKAPWNIRANAVAPGPIDTPLWRGTRSDEENAALMKKRSQVIPVGRLGQALEVAEAIAFLLGPRSSYVNGQTLNIDGGEIMN